MSTKLTELSLSNCELMFIYIYIAINVANAGDSISVLHSAEKLTLTT
jgi:hypothetical protein